MSHKDKLGTINIKMFLLFYFYGDSRPPKFELLSRKYGFLKNSDFCLENTDFSEILRNSAMLNLAIPCYPLLSCVIPCHPMPGPRLAASLGDVGQRMMVRPLLLVHSLFSASIYFPMRLTCICIHLYACCSIPIVLIHKYVYIAIYHMNNIVFYRVYMYVCIRYMYVWMGCM